MSDKCLIKPNGPGKLIIDLPDHITLEDGLPEAEASQALLSALEQWLEEQHTYHGGRKFTCVSYNPSANPNPNI